MTAEAIKPTRGADSVTGGGRDDTDRQPPAQALDGRAWVGHPSLSAGGAPALGPIVDPSFPWEIAVPRATVTVGPDPLARAVAAHSAARPWLDLALDERQREQSARALADAAPGLGASVRPSAVTLTGRCARGRRQAGRGQE